MLLFCNRVLSIHTGEKKARYMYLEFRVSVKIVTTFSGGSLMLN